MGGEWLIGVQKDPQKGRNNASPVKGDWLRPLFFILKNLLLELSFFFPRSFFFLLFILIGIFAAMRKMFTH